MNNRWTMRRRGRTPMRWRGPTIALAAVTALGAGAYGATAFAAENDPQCEAAAQLQAVDDQLRAALDRVADKAADPDSQREIDDFRAQIEASRAQIAESLATICGEGAPDAGQNAGNENDNAPGGNETGDNAGNDGNAGNGGNKNGIDLPGGGKIFPGSDEPAEDTSIGDVNGG